MEAEEILPNQSYFVIDQTYNIIDTITIKSIRQKDNYYMAILTDSLRYSLNQNFFIRGIKPFHIDSDINIASGTREIRIGPTISKIYNNLIKHRTFLIVSHDGLIKELFSVINNNPISEAYFEVNTNTNFTGLHGKYYIVTSSGIGGLTPYYNKGGLDNLPNRPILLYLYSNTANFIGYVYSHEQGHGFLGLSDCLFRTK